MSRPTKLNPQSKAVLIQAIEGGMNYEDACRLARITYKTFSNWMSKGRSAKSGIFFQFFQDIEYAKSKGLAFHLGVINTAARSGDWHASRFILQARHGYVINKEPLPAVQIQLQSSNMNVQALITEVQENNKLLDAIAPPVIDLDEE